MEGVFAAAPGVEPLLVSLQGNAQRRTAICSKAPALMRSTISLMVSAVSFCISFFQRSRPTSGSRAAPTYSKPAVNRVVACLNFPSEEPAKLGFRVMRQRGLARRARIIAGWVVVSGESQGPSITSTEGRDGVADADSLKVRQTDRPVFALRGFAGPDERQPRGEGDGLVPTTPGSTPPNG